MTTSTPSAERYATAWRPAYQASGGYAGAQAITALSKRFPRYWVGRLRKSGHPVEAAFCEIVRWLQRNSLLVGWIRHLVDDSHVPPRWFEVSH